MSRQTATGKITRIPCHTRCSSPTLIQAAAEWLTAPKVRLKQSTLSTYAGVARAHILPELGHTPINELNGETVSILLSEAAIEGLSPHTVGNISAVLRGILNYACHAGYISSVPDWSRPSGRTMPNSDVLTKREKKKLEEYLINNVNNRCSESFGLLLCLYTGIRLGELCALKWSDISLKNGTVSISRTVQRITIPAERQLLCLIHPKAPVPIALYPFRDFSGSLLSHCVKTKTVLCLPEPKRT